VFGHCEPLYPAGTAPDQIGQFRLGYRSHRIVVGEEFELGPAARVLVVTTTAPSLAQANHKNSSSGELSRCTRR
jgi:hypothetical protein